MQVPIKKWLDKVPGGIIIVPLFLGCLMNTLCPAALQIGSFTTGIVNGTSWSVCSSSAWAHSWI